MSSAARPRATGESMTPSQPVQSVMTRRNDASWTVWEEAERARKQASRQHLKVGSKLTGPRVSHCYTAPSCSRPSLEGVSSDLCTRRSTHRNSNTYIELFQNQGHLLMSKLFQR